MTRFTLTLSTIFLGIAAGIAAPLTPAQALGRAAASTSPTAKTATTSRFTATDLIYTGTFSDRDASPTFYIFSRPGEGFLIAGGDDVAAPVLGYSTTGTFSTTDMPENLRWWLSEYSAAIAAASKASTETTSFPLNAQRPERAPIAPIVKTKWNQNEPYNLLCPTMDNKLTYTGCVATAMAQVMKAHNWPAVGTGEHSYNWGVRTLSMNFAQTPFDWNNMLDSYSSSAYEVQKQAVATLMSACGISVDMNYGLTGSGAYSKDVAPALRKYFKYSVKTTYIPRDYFTLYAWEDYIYGSLKNGAPVYYSGQNTQVGHAFVCDGYDADGYFHFNWGWGGVSDGYFLLMGLDPRSQGIGGSTAGYNLIQGCILNAIPAQPDELGMIVMASIGVGYTISETNTLDVAGRFTNFGAGRRQLQMGVACVNAAGDTTILKANVRSLNGGGTIKNFSVPLPEQKFADGTYTIFPVVNVAVESGTPLWQPVNYSSDDPNVAYLTAENGNYTINMPDLELVTATDVQTPTPFYKGQPFVVSFTLTNPNPTESYDIIYVGLIEGNDLYDYSAPLAVSLRPGESKTVNYQGTFANAALSTYQLAVMTQKGNESLYLINENTPSVTLQNPPSVTAFEVTDFSIQNADAVNCSDMNFNVGVKCTKGYMYWPLTVYIYRTDGRQLFGYQSTDYYLLEANNSKTQVVNLSIPTLVPETDYIALLYNPGGATPGNLKQFTFKVKTNSVSSAEAAIGLNLFPTLIETTATLTSENPVKNVEVYSLDGRRQHVAVDGDPGTMTVNAAELPSGVYLMKVATSGGTATLKFVKK